MLFTTHHEEEMYVADLIWYMEDGRLSDEIKEACFGTKGAGA